MLFRLIVLSPPLAGRQITVDKAPMVIGSAPGCEIHIQDDEMFARHAMLEHREDGLHIRDIGSSGTILVNRREVRESLLKHGDEIEIGRTRFLVQARVRAEVDGSPSLAEPRRRRRSVPVLLAILLALAAGTAALHFFSSRPHPPLPAPDPLLSYTPPVAPIMGETPVAVDPPPPDPSSDPSSTPASVTASAPAVARSPAPAPTNAPPPESGDILKMREDINGIRHMMQTLVESQATNRNPGAPPPPPSSPPAASGWIRIVSIEGTKFPQTENYREMRAFAITLLQTATAELRDRPVRVEVSFFDQDPATGKVTPSLALAPRGPLEIQGDWAPGRQKSVTATYTVPPAGPRTPAGPEFHGYVVRVFCAGVLQDQKAKPPELLDLVKPRAGNPGRAGR